MAGKFNSFRTEYKKQLGLQLMVIPGIIFPLVFAYLPMYGILMAFQEFRLGNFPGLSKFVGFKQSDTGIARTLCEDYFKAELPKAIMADTAAESKAILMEILAFCDANGYSAVEKAYADAYATNVRLYGTAVTR